MNTSNYFVRRWRGFMWAGAGDCRVLEFHGLELYRRVGRIHKIAGCYVDLRNETFASMIALFLIVLIVLLFVLMLILAHQHIGYWGQS